MIEQFGDAFRLRICHSTMRPIFCGCLHTQRYHIQICENSVLSLLFKEHCLDARFQLLNLVGSLPLLLDVFCFL